MPMFGELVKRQRIAAGLSQVQLAKMSGVSQGTISRWEAGEREATWSDVQKVAKALGVDCKAFETEDSTAPPPVPPKKPRGRPKSKKSAE